MLIVTNFFDIINTAYKNKRKLLFMIKIKRFTSLILTAVIIMLALSACEKDTPHPEDEIIEYTLNSEPLSLDPQIANDNPSVMIIKNIFEGLVREDSNGNIVPGNAEKWEISENGTKYVFHLYETYWSNGDTVTADDFVFGMIRSLDPTTRSENAHDLYLIKNAEDFSLGNSSADDVGVKAIDNSTLEITLEYPSDMLLTALTLPAAMPCNEKFFSQSKGKYGKEPELTLTNGAFCIRENYGWEHNKYIFLRRSKNYKAGNPALPLGVNFNIGTVKDPINKMLSDEADICEIYGSQLKDAEKNGLTIETTSNTLWGICFNTDIKAFKNAKLRVSLLGSLDRNDILENVPESFKKTSQLISENVSFGGQNYRNSAGDITLDKAQLPSQMYERAVEELAEKEIEIQPSYTVLYLDDETSSRIVTKMIAKWNSVTNCYFNKEPLSRNELEQRIKSNDYEIAVAPLNTAVDSPMEFLSMFRNDSANNYINLNYPQYDEFIDSAMNTKDVSEMISYLKSAEKYLIEYGYLYPLYYENRYFAYAPNVSGAIFDTKSDTIDFTKVEKIKQN